MNGSDAMGSCPMSASRTGDLRTLLGLLVLWILARAAAVIALGDVFFYLEELAKGAAAQVMLQQPPVPHHQLAGHFYDGGAFSCAHFKALFFLLVGPSLLAHKLAALLWGAAILASGWRLARRHFGPQAGLLFGLLFVLAPEDLQKLSLLHVGNHWESTLFVLIVLDGAIGIGAGTHTRARDFAATGLAAGLGTYFSYQVPLITAPAILWATWHARGLVLGPRGALGLGSLLAGLAPFWTMLALVGERMFDIHGQSLLQRSGNLERLMAMLRSLVEGRSPREVASTFLLPLYAFGGCAWLALRGDLPVRSRALILAGCVAFWSGVYATSTFVLGAVYHYFVLARLAPPWVLLVLFSAIATSALIKSPSSWPRRLGHAALTVLLLLGALNTVAIVRAGRPGSPRANLELLQGTKGYSYAYYFTMILPHMGGDERTRLAALAGLEEDRRLLLGDLATAAFTDGSRELASILVAVDALDPAGRDELLKGLGPWLASRSGNDALTALDQANALGGELREPLCEAAGRFGGGWGDSPQLLGAQIALVVGRPGAEAWLRGAGQRLLRRFVLSPYGGPELVLNPQAALEWIARQPLPAQAPLREGFEQAREMLSLP